MDVGLEVELELGLCLSLGFWVWAGVQLGFGISGAEKVWDWGCSRG